jgi:hypothetical protein
VTSRFAAEWAAQSDSYLGNRSWVSSVLGAHRWSYLMAWGLPKSDERAGLWVILPAGYVLLADCEVAVSERHRMASSGLYVTNAIGRIGAARRTTGGVGRACRLGALGAVVRAGFSLSLARPEQVAELRDGYAGTHGTLPGRRELSQFRLTW